MGGSHFIKAMGLNQVQEEIRVKNHTLAFNSILEIETLRETDLEVQLADILAYTLNVLKCKL